MMDATTSHRSARLGVLLGGALIMMLPISFAAPPAFDEARQGTPAPALRAVQPAGRTAAQPGKVPPGLETSPMPLEWQIANLREQVRVLQDQVQVLQSRAAGESEAGHLAVRMAALENVVQIHGGGVRLNSPGNIELVAPGTVRMATGMLRVDGVARSEQVVTNSVVSAAYSPGAGNVW